MLFKYGANIKEFNHEKIEGVMHPVCMAASKGNEDALIVLLKNGGEPNSSYKVNSFKNINAFDAVINEDQGNALFILMDKDSCDKSKVEKLKKYAMQKGGWLLGGNS
ncbi:hypothetical protein GPJ56_000645 [Histomonas meleagridis]|uniref:uncharacterized protein n=1 Tax=Histomonas meleagridis TaxID=135588 RepID=UPI00355AC28E|nr:hypothetical protein GPJ56_000645 [Histomonas meleagridis]KAH0804773.1 hypothetical protein GO595_002467 [Histomonas meleagridis]